VGMLASIHEGVIECWHVQLPAVNWLKQRRHPRSRILAVSRLTGRTPARSSWRPRVHSAGGLGVRAAFSTAEARHWRGGHADAMMSRAAVFPEKAALGGDAPSQATIGLAKRPRFCSHLAATGRDLETFQGSGRYEGGTNDAFFRSGDK
jgi:hypothetical protein